MPLNSASLYPERAHGDWGVSSKSHKTQTPSARSHWASECSLMWLPMVGWCGELMGSSPPRVPNETWAEVVPPVSLHSSDTLRKPRGSV